MCREGKSGTWRSGVGATILQQQIDAYTLQVHAAICCTRTLVHKVYGCTKYAIFLLRPVPPYDRLRYFPNTI